MTTAEHDPPAPRRARAAWDRFTGQHADRHHLDDPFIERALFLIGAGIQVWSTWHLVLLASWAYGNGFTGLVNSLFYDAFALVALRVGTDTKYASAVRTMAWVIAAACFGVTLTGNLIAHHVLQPSGELIGEYAERMTTWQPWIRDILGSAPVLLLVACLVLVALIKAQKRRVVAHEHWEAQRQAKRDADAAAAEQARIRADEETAEQRRRADAEQETRRLEALATAERAKLEAERIRVEGELAAAQAAATPPPPPAPEPEPVVDDLADTLAALLADIPTNQSKTDRCRALILECWKRGITPQGSDFDTAVDSDGMGRREIRKLRADGHRPAERTLQLVSS